MSQIPFEQAFRMDVLDKLRGTYGNWNKENDPTLLWLFFATHKRLERLEKANNLAPVELPKEVGELNFWVDAFWKIWKQEQLMGMGHSAPVDEEFEKVREQFIHFFEMVQRYQLCPPRIPESSFRKE